MSTRLQLVSLVLIGLVVVPGCANKNEEAAKESAQKKQHSKKTSGGKLDLTYLPKEAVAAAFAFPKRLRSIPELELLPYEIMQAAGEQEFGFDPLEIEQAIAFFAAPKLPSPPEAGLILRFAKRPSLSGKITRNYEQNEFEGTSYLKPANPRQPCFCLIDDTLLVAAEAMLQKMISTRRADGPLHSLLSEASGDSDVTAVVAFSELRELLRANLQKLPPLPPDLHSLKSLPEHLESAVVRANLAAGRETTITLKAPNPESAEKLETALLQAMSFAKQMMVAQLTQQVGAQDDPLQAATMKYMVRVADSIETQLKPKRDGDKLVISARSDIGTTGVLVALLLPAVQAAREAARRAQSSNNLKQIGLGMHNHHDARARFPAAANYKDGKPLLSWRVHLLPYLGESRLYDQFKLDEPWDSQHNKTLIDKMPAVYQNPNTPEDEFKTNYLLLTGKGTLFDGQQGTSFAAVTDGLSQTIMVVEADANRAVIWTKPSDIEFDPSAPMNGLGNLRPGGFLAGIGDGSVRFISNAVDPDVLRALVTRAGGDPPLD